MRSLLLSLIAATLYGCDDLGVLSTTPLPYDRCAADPLVNQLCDWRSLVAKTSTGACGLGRFVCDRVMGLHCLAAGQPQTEICDRVDNDCDGDIDEQADMPVSVCYDGPSQALLHGDCRPGVTRCVLGAEICHGQILPQLEVCDRIDNDCDGSIDWSADPDSDMDLVMIVDRSCSMTSYIDAVRRAVRDNPPTPNLNIWLVDLPGSPGYGSHDYALNVHCHGSWDGITAIAPCTPTAFMTAVSVLAADKGNEEDSYDALADIINGVVPIAWGTDTPRRIVFFGDEAGQSYRGLTEADIAMLLMQQPAFEFVGFVHPDHVTDYDSLGVVSDITLPDLRTAVIEIYEGLCIP